MRQCSQFLQQRIRQINGAKFVGSIIIKVHHLDMTTKASHFALHFLLESYHYAYRNNHHHHSD